MKNNYFKFILFLTLIVSYNYSFTQGASCATATSVTVGGACASGTISDGTVNDPNYGGTCTISAARDGWYSFVATATSTNIEAISNNRQLAVAVYGGTCGALTNLACRNANTTAGGQTETVPTITTVIGTTYYVRIINETANNLTLNSLCITAPLPGQTCASATTLACGTTNQAATTVGTPGLAHGTTCSMSDYGVWYTFVGDGQQTTVSIGSSYDIELSINSGSCGSFTNIVCTDTPESHTFTTVAGVTYYVYVSYWLSGTTTGTFTISRTCNPAPTPPANDNCAGATPLTVNADLNCGTQTAGTVTAATASGTGLGSCGGTADDDVWYTFVATGTTHQVGFNNATGSTTDFMCSVYSGACGSLTQLNCNEWYGSGSASVTGLTAGSTYRVRIFSWSSSIQSATFNVCVGTPPPPPSNDNCGGATPLTVNADLNCGSQTAGTVTSATASGTGLGSCSGTADDDVWYSFVATGTTHNVGFNNATGTTTDFMCSVYSGACGSLTQLNCNEWYGSGSAIVTGLTAGSTYRVRMFSWSSTAQTATFNVCVGTPPPPPSNDNCGGATAFPVVPTNGTCSSLNNQSTTSATNSGVTPTGTCTSNFGTPDDDVWFSFVASATTIQMNASYVSGNTDVYWQVFSGGCGASMASIFCSDTDAGGNLTGLTVGSTYRIRLYTYSGTGNSTQNICLQTPPPPPSNDNCTGATAFGAVPTNGTCVSLSNQSTNGATNSNVTPTGSCTSNFGTPDEDVWFSFVASATSINLSATNVAGSTDVYWQVFSGACGATMTSILCTDNNGGGSLTGLTVGSTYRIRMYSYSSSGYTTESLCLQTPPPPPPNSNCTGTIQFCPASPVTINAVTGTTAPAGNNYGCLFSQPNPYFYYFTANAAGTLNLDLNAPSDVDFALWGPYANVAAANAACGAYPAPIDCSYSSAGLESIDVAAAAVGQVFVLLVTNFANVNQNISLSFDDANSAGDCACVPLPITLSSFNVSVFGKNNIVKWETSTEINNDYFLVQRSKDGQIWETLKLVKGQGNSNVQNRYQFIDEKPLLGLSYYRLKQVDFDGVFAFSDLQIVDRKSLDSYKIYPQPAKDEFKINGNIGEITHIEMIDMMGKKSKVSFKLENGEYNIDVNGFSNGLYLLNIYNNQNVISEKIIIE